LSYILSPSIFLPPSLFLSFCFANIAQAGLRFCHLNQLFCLHLMGGGIIGVYHQAGWFLIVSFNWPGCSYLLFIHSFFWPSNSLCFPTATTTSSSGIYQEAFWPQELKSSQRFSFEILKKKKQFYHIVYYFPINLWLAKPHEYIVHQF
jgi:hypothetical protein